jgi:hypothetical protein
MTQYRDNLRQMHRSGTITTKMREDAQRFYEACEGKETWPARAIMALGGFTSPGGSCLWHVVVQGVPLYLWAAKTGLANQSSAAGVLICVLGALPTITTMVGDGSSYTYIYGQKVNVSTYNIVQDEPPIYLMVSQVVENVELTDFVHEVGER